MFVLKGVTVMFEKKKYEDPALNAVENDLCLENVIATSTSDEIELPSDEF